MGHYDEEWERHKEEKRCLQLVKDMVKKESEERIKALKYRTPEGLYDMKDAMAQRKKGDITASDVQARQWENSAIQQMELEKMMQTGTKCDRNKALDSLNGAASSTNKYNRVLRGGATLDVYDVLDAFKVDNPAVQHALKKMLCAGSRGHKDYMQDIQEAIDSLERAKSFAPIPF
jgi:hypothetical protein